MKKIILSLVMLLSASAMMAQSVARTINELRQDKAFTYVNVDKNMLKMASIAGKGIKVGDEINLGSVPEGIDSIKVLATTKDNKRAMKKLRKAKFNWDGEGYKQLIKTVDEGDHVVIYIKPNGNRYKEMVIVTTEDDGECALVQLFGDIDPSKLQNMDD